MQNTCTTIKNTFVFQENNLSKRFKKLRFFRLYCCQLIFESIRNVHLKFHCTVARDTNLTVIFPRGSGVQRDCADVLACESINHGRYIAWTGNTNRFTDNRYSIFAALKSR